MNIRVILNVLLVRLGLRRILPSDYINGIKLSESHDPIVQLMVDESLVKTDGNVFVGRKGMIEHLLKAAKASQIKAIVHRYTKRTAHQRIRLRDVQLCIRN